jgi:hypothetical protein
MFKTFEIKPLKLFKNYKIKNFRVGNEGVEPSTSSLSEKRSNQLS